MDLQDWIDALCDSLNIEFELDRTLVLDVARDAAHQVDRPAAPLTTFLLGYAAGRQDADPDDVEELAERVTTLARSWGQPAPAHPPSPRGEEPEDSDLIDPNQEEDA